MEVTIYREAVGVKLKEMGRERDRPLQPPIYSGGRGGGEGVLCFAWRDGECATTVGSR